MGSVVRRACAGLAILAVVVLPGVDGAARAQGAVPPERRGTVQCTNADLAASYRAGGSATSHRYGWIRLRNVSDHDCRTGGFGGLSYVGNGDGTQIGAAADREPGRIRTIVLRPGERVRSRVTETSAGPYPRRKCRPAHVDGFRVYVPNATESQYIEHPTTGCRNAAVHLLSHRAYRR